MSKLNRRAFLGTAALAAPAMSACAAEAAPMPQRTAAAAPLTEGGRGVRTGADVLAAKGWSSLGRRVGVVANPTAVLADLTHVVDDMVGADAAPVAVFGPEHGFRGTGQAGESEGTIKDPRTGVTVYDAYTADYDDLVAMYRESKVDTVVFDIANLGCRFYTYTWAMYRAMVAAARTDLKFVVLDRPNPIGGTVAGPMLDPKYASGVGFKPVVQQLGMTCGELARMFNEEYLPKEPGGAQVPELEVVKARGWRRDELFSETGQQWVPPSPNVPTPDTALLYPGTCLFEGTVFSEGRGTTRPFENIGAPGIDWRWAEKLNEANLPGVLFREAYFLPAFGDKFLGKTCGGVHVHITDPHRLDAIRTAITMIVTAKRLYPKVFAWRADNFIDKLFGTDRLRKMVDKGAGVREIISSWEDELARFDRMRRQYLIYR